MLSYVEVTAQYIVTFVGNDTTELEELRQLESEVIHVLVDKRLEVIERLAFQNIVEEIQDEKDLNYFSNPDLTNQFKMLGAEKIVAGKIIEESDDFIYVMINVVDIEAGMTLYSSTIKTKKVRGRIDYLKFRKSLYDNFNKKFGIDSNEDKEDGFPFPPPKPSARETISIAAFPNTKNLKDTYDFLNYALNQCGYYEKSVYKIPNGFALVTRIEKINGDGASKTPPERWSIKQKSSSKFSVSDYIKSLFSSNPGFYRVIVFVVTDVPFATTAISPSKKEAITWLHKGLNKLPKDVGAIPLNKEHLCSVLIYEFKFPESGEDAFLMNPSLHTGRTHLVKANLWKHFDKRD